MAIIGFVEEINDSAVAGWALDEELQQGPTQIRLFIDDIFVQAVCCEMLRPDLRAINVPHIQAGFVVAIPPEYRDGRTHSATFKDAKHHVLVLGSIDGPAQEKWDFCIADECTPAANFAGFIEDTSNGHVGGWLIDRASDEPARIKMFVDNIFYKVIICDQERKDVHASGEPRAAVGFSVKMPSRFFDGRAHKFFFSRADDEGLIGFHQSNAPGGGLKHTFEASSPRYVCLGRVDGLQNGAIRGWCLVLDRYLDTKFDSCEIIIRSGGQIIGQVTANQPRPDVAAAFDASMLCGFSYVPPSELAIGRTLHLIFTVANYGLALPGSPVKVDYLDQHSYAILNNLLTEVDELFTRTWKIRTLIKNLIPNHMYNINSYHHWATRYLEDLARRCAAAPPTTSGPLVSILCPAYKPRPKDFQAAVQSVIDQTYKNWELIIVDDASRSEQLTQTCRQLSAQDNRIVFISLAENAGISGASNIAVEQARGAFILLFDHDDLLVPQAVQVMLQHQAATGAKMLYSDEDKIDDDGQYSEVHLKPDWNYRLLLSQNYVCHLLLIEHEHLRKTGSFRSAFDGAQDHDLILRLSESLTRDQIVHVPEILYHWRKTPSSTAASGASKGYAVSAGARCIEDHLARRGLPAVVEPLRGATIYQVRWQFDETPSVSVIIPYREQIPITRQCVNSLLDLTDYSNFNVVLADNWSDSSAAQSFRDEYARHPRVSYVRVPERFNYSRINNLAVATTASDYILFLNNDVMTIRPDWMRLMVDELLANEEVAIVGIKLLYPNGLVQHGGVVLGVGGIADHAHKMLKEQDPGYMARAICAQEISAVTAACLLCRRSVFEAVGGFDEKDLHVAFNDVDFCLRVGAAGHRVVWLPNAVAEHHESLSRGNDMVPSQQVRFFHEHEVMMDRWREAIADDPYYNLHFSRRSDIYIALERPES